ncbi:MAG: hypothetical protein ABIH46_09055 [Chloroflexota bacterium]
MTVCTTAFLPLARRQATALEFPSLQLVPFPHPVSGIPIDELERRADAILDDIVAALIDPRPSVARS